MALFVDLVALSNGLHGSVQMDSVALFSWIGWLRHHGIFTLADYFNVSTDYILGRTENKATPDTTSAFESLLVENYSSLTELRNLNLDEKAIVTSIIANCVNLINLKNK